MEQELLKAAEAFVASHVWEAVAVFMTFFLSSKFIMRMTKILNEQIIIRTDTFGIGATVYHNKQKAMIRHIGFRRIELFMVESRESKFVSTAEWKNFELVVPDFTEIN